MKNLLSVVITAVVLFSCTAKKPLSELPKEPSPALAETTFFDKIKTPPTFQQVKINAKVVIQADAFIPPLDATIYIANGQKVWMNMSALFLNVGRGIATQDGIKGYEKWNKTYIDSDFTYLNNLLGVNFIDYTALQNLLLGKTFIPVNEKDFSLATSDQGYTLSSKRNQKITTDGKTSEYSMTLRYTPETDLTRVLLNEVHSGDQLEITYSGWATEGDLRVPKSVKIIIKSSKTSQIIIENATFAFDKMETPYSVPSNYKKTDIK